MSLPKAVIAAQERADALIAAMQGGAPAPAPEAPQPAPAAAPAPTQGNVAPATDSPFQQPASAPADGTAEHRYSVLQGKYNAEVPRLSDQVRDLQAQNQQNQRLIEQLTQQLKAAPPVDTKLVKPEEVEEYGEGLVDVIRRTAREELASKDAAISELRTELHQLRNGVSQTRQVGFLEKVAAAHGDWVVINDDPTFHRWLAQIDPLAGRTRQDLLDEAHAQQNGDRAAAVFTAFKKDRDSWAAASANALQTQIVPAAGANGAVPRGTPGARVWTRLEVQNFYTEVRTGKLKGAEAAAVESEIQRAMIEGRIQ